MGSLQSSEGDSCIVFADHLIGRAPGSTLCLEDSSISWRHAALRWIGNGWELQDLGSRNGTYVNGTRVDSGGRMLVRAGAHLRFGNSTQEWTLVDDAPPVASVLSIETGEHIFAQDGLIGLPSSEEPELSVYARADGTWVAERADRSWELKGGDVIEAGQRRFTFKPGAVVSATTSGQLDQPVPHNIALEFVVSRNEEHVDLTIVHQARRIPLKPRAHIYVLLTLARLRARDQQAEQLPATSHGWVEQEKLLSMLACSQTQLAVDIYRARRQFGKAGILDSAQVVERRMTSHELRLGVPKFSIDVT